MVKWQSRAVLYKFASIMSYLVFLLYGLAFGIPMWLESENALTNGDYGIFGLWVAGEGHSSNIDNTKDTGFGEAPIDKDWFDAVRGLWLAGMALYLFGVLASFIENCCVSIATKDYGISAVLIMLAGLCGGTGVVVTAVEIEDGDFNLDYMWGYIIAVVSSGLAIVLSLILLITKNYGLPDVSKNSRTADYVYAHKQHQRMYGPEYTNPSYRGDELPLANGTPHQQHTPYSHSPYSMYRPGNENGLAGSKYDQGSSYYPYGYKESRPGNRISMAESADLSNGYTHDIVNAENSLDRRGNYGRSQQYGRSDYFYSGSRPY